MNANQQGLQLVKFPTITKLQYLGEQIKVGNVTARSKFHYKTSYSKFSTTTSHPLQTTNQQFKLVQLPDGGDIINICTMHINENKLNQDEEDYANQNKVNLEDILQKKYLRKGKSLSVFNKINFQQIENAKKSSNLSKFIELSNNDSASNKNAIKLSVKKSQHLTKNKINPNQLYIKIISALALINGGVNYCNSSSSFQKMRKGKIEKGNNGYIVKQTAKKRSWWNVSAESQGIEGANLIWTESQLKYEKMPALKQPFFNKIQKQENKHIVFQRNIDQALLFYPKILQLFFTDHQFQNITGKTNQTYLINKSRSLTSFPSKQRNNQKQISILKSSYIYKFLSQSSAEYFLSSENTTIYNHIPNNREITSKKMLYKNVWEFCENKQIYQYSIIPKTYHITAFDWQQKIEFIQHECEKDKNAWFLKPGENSNRGKGISVHKSTKEILDYIMRNPPKSIKKSYIMQQYIQPLLYESRKFDIRTYMLCIQVFNVQTFYWYEEGYIRTCSQKFTLNKTSPEIHLTNDAVQKEFNNYDKFESANKLSYTDLDKYLKNQNGIQFFSKVLPEMKKIACNISHAAQKLGCQKIDHEEQLEEKGIYFEVFGLDYILDHKGKPFLLEVNTNPCLEINSNLMSRIIPEVLENTFRIVLDVFMPLTKAGVLVAPDWSQNFLLNNKFSLLHRRKLTHNKDESKKAHQQQEQQEGQDVKIQKQSKLKLNKIQQQSTNEKQQNN